MGQSSNLVDRSRCLTLAQARVEFTDRLVVSLQSNQGDSPKAVRVGSMRRKRDREVAIGQSLRESTGLIQNQSPLEPVAGRRGVSWLRQFDGA